jgi:hypothetical protein
VSDQSLEAILLEHAAALGEVGLRVAGSATEVVADGVVVAVIAPGGFEVGLRPAVATAALRTPDVEPSPRGRGWIRFAPAALDGFARDRAVAWLESAVRLVVEGDERR